MIKLTITNILELLNGFLDLNDIKIFKKIQTVGEDLMEIT